MKPKDHRTRWKTLSLCITAALFLNLCLSGCAPKKTPAEQLVDSLTATSDQLEQGWTESSFYKVLNGGSISVNLGSKDLLESFGMYNMNISADLNCYLDSANNNSVIQLFTYLDDISFADFSIYQIDDEIIADSDALLGGAYGLNLSETPDESAYDSTDPAMQQIYSFLQRVSAMKTYGTLAVKAEKLEDAYLDLLATLVEKYGQTASKTGDTQINGKSITADVVTVSIDHEGLANLVNDLGTYFLQDEEMRTFLQDFGTILDDMNAEGLDMLEYASELENMYTTMETELGSTVEQIRQSDIQCDTSFYISQKTGGLMAFDGTFHVDGEVSTIQLQLGENIKDSDYFSLVVNDGTDSLMMESKVTENSDTVYSLEFSIVENAEMVYSYQVDWDKTTGDFVWNLTNDYDDFAFKLRGTLQDQGAAKTIVIDDFYYNDGSTSLTANLGMTILLKEKDTMPSPPEYSHISLLDSDEVEANLTSLILQVYGYIYSR